MARFFKNPDIVKGGRLAARLPISTSSLSDGDPTNGLIRFNTTNSKVEFYYNSKWNQIAKIGTVQLVVDDLTGDGLSQVFTMAQAETDESSIAVFIGGVYQQPVTNYTVNGTTAITFTSAPPAPGVNPNKITIIHNINSTDAA
jgi:hypothetical protein